MTTSTRSEPLLDMATHIALKSWRWTAKETGQGPGFGDTMGELSALLNREGLDPDERTYIIDLMVSDAAVEENLSFAMHAASLYKDPIRKALTMRDLVMEHVTPEPNSEVNILLKDVVKAIREIDHCHLRDQVLADLQRDLAERRQFVNAVAVGALISGTALRITRQLALCDTYAPYSRVVHYCAEELYNTEILGKDHVVLSDAHLYRLSDILMKVGMLTEAKETSASIRDAQMREGLVNRLKQAHEILQERRPEPLQNGI